jgi:hypothetical protein
MVNPVDTPTTHNEFYWDLEKELFMKYKIFYLLLLLLLVLVLVACGGSDEGQDTPNMGSSESSIGDIDTQEIPQVMQLMLGIVLLDGTEHAVDADQAENLLPLWKVLKNLSSSEIAAQAEVDAVIASIQDTMTSEQMASIEGMNLTMENMTEVAEILGIETDFGGRFGEMDPEMQATMEAMRENGEGPPEGFGPGQGFGRGMSPGGQGFGGLEGLTPEMRETAMAERDGVFGRGFGINTRLLEAIIDFLENKA